MVNGRVLKALIEEEFGDGIMPAIDFDLGTDRLSHPKGDRIRFFCSANFSAANITALNRSCWDTATKKCVPDRIRSAADQPRLAWENRGRVSFWLTARDV
jgi:hypothetical protein